MNASTSQLDGSVRGADLGSRYRVVRRVTLVGSAVDLALGIGKLVGGWLTQSQALLVDGVHSLSDLATDLLVLFAAKHAHVEADEEHPYGHGRIETAATVGLGIALIAIGIGLTVDAGQRLFHPETLWHPNAWALAIAAVSVIAKEAVYHYTMRFARKLNSALLRANAWHSRSDALSSVVVIVGVGGALLGLDYLDAVAALIVAGMIAKIGFDLARSSVKELIDTGLGAEQLDEIREAILSVDGVEDLHLLRTREMAGQALIDVHIILDDPRVSVSEGHQISETVRARLMRRIDNVADVTVHIDPEDDEHAAPGKHLGLRDQVMARLQAHWEGLPEAAQIRRLNLHYLDGRIQVEVELPRSLARDEARAAALVDAFNRSIEDDPQFSKIRVLFS